MEQALNHGKLVNVLEQSGSLSRVAPEGADDFDAVWVKTSQLKPAPKTDEEKKAAAARATRIEKAQHRIREVVPDSISAPLLAWLQTQPVKIRVFYPDAVESAVQERFSVLGLSLPEDIRPVHNEQYGLSSEVHFPAPPFAGILPEGAKVAGETVTVYRNTFALGLLEAGFKINSYAKQKPVVQ